MTPQNAKKQITKEQYEAAVKEISKNTDLLWNRFNTFSAYEGAMIGLAIIIAIQAYGQITNKLITIASSLMLLFLSMIGIIITFKIWLPIHKKTSEYVKYWIDIVKQYEKQENKPAYSEFFENTAKEEKGLIRQRVILLIKIIGITWILFLLTALSVIIRQLF